MPRDAMRTLLAPRVLPVLAYRHRQGRAYRRLRLPAAKRSCRHPSPAYRRLRPARGFHTIGSILVQAFRCRPSGCTSPVRSQFRESSCCNRQTMQCIQEAGHTGHRQPAVRYRALVPPGCTLLRVRVSLPRRLESRCCYKFGTRQRDSRIREHSIPGTHSLARRAQYR